MGEQRRTRGQAPATVPELNFAEMAALAASEVRRLRHAEEAARVYREAQWVQDAVIKLGKEQADLEPRVVTLRQAVAAGEAREAEINETIATLTTTLEDAKAAQVAVVQEAGRVAHAAIAERLAAAQASSDAALVAMQDELALAAAACDEMAKEVTRLERIATRLRSQLLSGAAAGS